jgi:hypothetical protein
MNRIQRVSLFFRIIFQLIFVALPILVIIAWTQAPDQVVLFSHVFTLDAVPKAYQQAILHPLSASEKMTGFLLNCVPLVIELFILYSMIKLFRLYEQNEIFSLSNVRHIRNIGFSLLAYEILDPFYQFFMGIILTMNNPHGHRFAAITLDQTNVGIILTALMVILISWIMAEGCKLREETLHTI